MKKVALVLGVALLTGCGFFPNGAHAAHHRHQQIAVMPVAVKMSGYGITFRLEPDNIGYIDDKVAAVEEDNEVATVYAVGLNMVIWYKHKHKAALVDHSGRFVGWLQ